MEGSYSASLSARQHYVMTSKEYLTISHILFKYFELVFVRLLCPIHPNSSLAEYKRTATSRCNFISLVKSTEMICNENNCARKF